MFTGKAKLSYYSDYCVAYVDEQLASYYYSLIPKYYCANKQMWPAHITVARYTLDTITRPELWKKYDGGLVNFEYDGRIHTDAKRTYFWLNCMSKDIGRIRTDLGASEFVPGFNCYHITIGNTK